MEDENKKVKKKSKPNDLLKKLNKQIEAQELVINNTNYGLGMYNGLLIARMLLTGKDEILKVFPPRLR
jgi:hypothetical protein